MPKNLCKPVHDDALQRMAHVLGSSSAAAKAMAELRRRRAAGEQVFAYQVYGEAGSSTLIVGPMIEGDPRGA